MAVSKPNVAAGLGHLKTGSAAIAAIQRSGVPAERGCQRIARWAIAGRLLKTSQASASQGKNRRESAVYTQYISILSRFLTQDRAA
jgi:hypothetical protein